MNDVFDSATPNQNDIYCYYLCDDVPCISNEGGAYASSVSLAGASGALWLVPSDRVIEYEPRTRLLRAKRSLRPGRTAERQSERRRATGNIIQMSVDSEKMNFCDVKQ